MPHILTMPKIRILPAFAIALIVPLAAWAQGPIAPPGPGAAQTTPPGAGKAADPTANEPPTDADKQLDEAIKLVAALKSVSADINQAVDLLDQKFSVSGRYLKAQNNRVYLNLKVSGLADATGQMLQVCDGQTLWDYQQILDSQSYRKIGVTQVFQKLSSPDIDPEMRTQIYAQFGFSGPEEMIRGLRKSVRFTQKDPGTLDGKDVWVLRGEWRDRSGLLGPNSQPISPTMPLPAYVPSLVVLTIGQADGWPYKLRLVGRRPPQLLDTRKVGPDGRPIGSRNQIADVKPTVVELTYSNVKLNPDLKLEEFVFQAPPNARVDDATQALVSMLDQAIQVNAAKKRAEAGKAEDPVLNQSIAIPKVNAGVEPNPAPTSPGGGQPK